MIFISGWTNPMILAIDVQYTDDKADVAGVIFENWSSLDAIQCYLTEVAQVAEYEPGSFYKRELPCILQLLQEHKLKPDIIVVDGYVYLDGVAKSGLGKHLYDSLGGEVEIIGVAKKPFVDISEKFAVYRGGSQKPLYVTSTGDVEQAKESIRSMAGKHRNPVLLKKVDQLCREAAKKRIAV